MLVHARGLTGRKALTCRCAGLQDLAKLNPAELTPLSPEVISRQATINIGTASLNPQAWKLLQAGVAR